MRYIAPAGTKITFSELFNALINLFKSKDILDDFREAICEKFSVKYCFFWGTGRTGMAFLLKSLHDLDKHQRNEVIIPSYTCYSVPASIEYAGLKVRICDIDLHTMDFDYSKLMNQNFDNVLAVLSANLYGIPNNLEELEKLAKEKKIYFIDDAAQSMGAMLNKRYAGTFGDAGLFSLDKGKNITTINGGITITNSDEIAKKLKSYQKVLKDQNILRKIILGFKIIIYSVFLKPSLYWIPNKLPFLNLGKTVYDNNLPLSKYTKLQAALAFELLKKLDHFSDKRIKNASELTKNLRNIENVKLPVYSENSKPVFVRFPILVDVHDRSILINKMNSEDIGASNSYPNSVYDIPETQKFQNKDCSNGKSGKLLAQKIITLPTHQYVTDKDIHLMTKIINDTVNEF